VEPVSLPEGARAEVSILDADPVIEARTRFSAAIGVFPADVLDKMEQDIDEAFGRVDPDAWK